jgi:hypothetical protein
MSVMGKRAQLLWRELTLTRIHRRPGPRADDEGCINDRIGEEVMRTRNLREQANSDRCR